jgi:hypothetical protein
LPSTIQTHPVVVVGIFTVVVLRTTVYVVSVVLEAEGSPTGAVDGPVVVVTMPVTIDSFVVDDVVIGVVVEWCGLVTVVTGVSVSTVVLDDAVVVDIVVEMTVGVVVGSVAVLLVVVV